MNALVQLLPHAPLPSPPLSLSPHTPPPLLQVMYGINFYGPLYLTHLLIPCLQQTAAASSGAGTPGHTRIVWNASPVETVGKTDWSDMK